MISEIPQYCLRAYSLFFTRHGPREQFKQSELDWIVGQSMRKKIFSTLLRAGWIVKASRGTYKCMQPETVIEGLLEFKVPRLMKEASKPYAFTNLSAIEVWSDYSYVQRGIEKSPYFIKVLRKDLQYWKRFFNKINIPNYIKEGSTIGEYVILIPVNEIKFDDNGGLKVEPLKDSLKTAKANEMYSYAYNYMRKKYGTASD
ncbi:hypothetical protein HYX06_05505 [Candidatus Woesearchaeota archaeon]|nr:hypothetical protein [Candidatus Woesearchaeota archaeon]